MCGILGGVWRRTSSAPPQFELAIDTLRLRGPDDSGLDRYDCGPSLVALGHTRLSIIDLSSAGHQPMSSADGRYSIVFNGEIYNYLELRAQLRGVNFATERLIWPTRIEAAPSNCSNERRFP